MLFPNFWLKPKSRLSILPFLLFPLSICWRGLGYLKTMLELPYREQVPVICIGNITIGGNGKTPTAMKLRSLLQDLGYNPHILSRGYKSKLKGPHLVKPEKDSFLNVGDEALMMSFYGPTWISRNRRSGIKSAVSSGANVIILDDGFQNKSIRKDFSILVIEASIGFGNGFLIPAGPLRETLSSGLNRADLILIIGEREAQAAFEKDFMFIKSLPIIRGKLLPRSDMSHLKGKAIVAFAGIAHPKKFETTLKNLGANVIIFKEFPNHKPFKIYHLNKLISQARKSRALLVTTEKDFVRIPKNIQHKFEAVEVTLQIENETLLTDKVIPIL